MIQNVAFETHDKRQAIWFTGQRSWFLHFHSQAELIISFDGEFILCVDNKDYTIKKDECGIVFPYQPHEIKPVSCSSSIVILFDISSSPLFDTYFTEYLPLSNRVDREHCPDFIPSLAESYRDHSFGKLGVFDGISQNAFAELIFSELLSRIPLKKVGKKCNFDTLNAIVSWCNKNYTSAAALDDAARDLFLSKSTISHTFSKNLNLTFTKYINSLRVGHACDLLKNTDLHISEVAFDSGFNSLWTFNRVFLELTGMSPKTYRLQALENT